MLSPFRSGGNVGSTPAIPAKEGQPWPEIQLSDLPRDILIPRLRGVSQASEQQWYARCPAHVDQNPSLSITEAEDKRLLIYCHRGCDYEDILESVGLEKKHLFPTSYARYIAQATSRHKVQKPNSPVAPSEIVPSNPCIPDSSVALFAERLEEARKLGPSYLPFLVDILHLPFWSLNVLNIGITRRGDWAFPEYDGRVRVVGISLRRNDGSKYAVRTSTRGLTLPIGILEDTSQPLWTGPLFVAEGATDTASLLSVGCLAIGRPAANPSANVRYFLIDFLQNHPAFHLNRPIVIVADNDEHGAGIQGALSTKSCLEQALGRPVLVGRPPDGIKDVREQVITGEWTGTWHQDLRPVHG